jgi:hypothetical protein
MDDGISSGIVIEQVGREFQVLTLDDNSYFLHRMKREIGHAYLLSSESLVKR